jgi:hypothetical protein
MADAVMPVSTEVHPGGLHNFLLREFWATESLGANIFNKFLQWQINVSVGSFFFLFGEII